MNITLPHRFSVNGKVVTEAHYDSAFNRTTLTVIEEPRSPQGTTIHDLIERQAELQRLGKHYGQRGPREGELRLAYLAELGEFIQELKPSWSWWRKEGSRAMVDEEKAVGELADLLHFVLIEALGDSEVDLRVPLTQFMWNGESDLPLRRPEIEAASLGDSESELETLPLDEFLIRADRFLASIELDLEDLVDAYYDKTDVNLARWQAVEQTPEQFFERIDAAIEQMINDPLLEDLLSTPAPQKTPMEAIALQLGFRY